MDGNVVLLFYSKYSPVCIELLNKIRDRLDFRKICVDNKDIRDTIIMDSSKYQVLVVPTIFVFFANGIMKKYEGTSAVTWSIELCNKIQEKLVYEKQPLQEEIIPEKKQITKVLDLPISDDLGLKRKIDSTPLIPPKELKEEERMDGNRNDIKVMQKKNDIKSLAQQLQAQREMDDEIQNPNAVSKVQLQNS